VTTARAARYVHRRAVGDAGQHDYSLDVTVEAESNYVRWVAEMCGQFLGPRVLDLGAGHGAVTWHLAAGREVTALDASADCVAALRTRFDGVPGVRVVQGDLRSLEVSDRFDSVLMTNVLEHILDDAAALRDVRAVLEPGGTLVVYVPALNGLYTAWDQKVGHYRRYSKRRLAGVVAEAGLTPIHLRYVNFLAVPAWLTTGLMVNCGTGTIKSLGLWDRTAIPLSRWLESRVHPPIGLNLLCVAQ
jgi:SAM-dependent methyltransferase